MINAGIFDGDFVIVRQQATADAQTPMDVGSLRGDERSLDKKEHDPRCEEHAVNMDEAAGKCRCSVDSLEKVRWSKPDEHDDTNRERHAREEPAILLETELRGNHMRRGHNPVILGPPTLSH